MDSGATVAGPTTYNVPCSWHCSKREKSRRTFSRMLARLQQKALKFPCVELEPSPRLPLTLRDTVTVGLQRVPIL